MALYLRLSKEDGDLADESNSITNQRYILRRYLEGMAEAGQYQVREYIDDGYSGKNFERPGVQQLLEDVKKGRLREFWSRIFHGSAGTISKWAI